MNRPRLRFLHTSDVHLGAYEYGNTEHDEKRRAEMRENFRRMIDLGLRERVDFMVIAGDFFDSRRVWDDTLLFAAREIARLEAPVIIAPGNHDHVGPDSVYDRMDLTERAQNLSIMRDPEGESIRLESLDVELWGRSHTEQDPYFSPFEGAPRRGDAAWHLGVGHGQYIHPRAMLEGSFHIFKEHLEPLDWDYVALGHWENQARVDGGGMVAAYSGAPDGLVGGRDCRCLVVDLLETGEVRLASHSLMDGEDPIPHEEIPFLTGMTWDEAVKASYGQLAQRPRRGA